MNIAIVDDEKVELETAETFLRVYIEDFWKNYESLIHIETFYSVKDFLTFFCPKIYQLVILGGHMKKFAKYISSIGDSDIKIFLLDSDCEEDL